MVMTVRKTTARRKFGGYKPETPKAIREAKVKENEPLRNMKVLFENLLAYKAERTSPMEPERLTQPQITNLGYGYVFPKIDFPYSSSDVALFCIALAEFEGREEFPDKAGIFLSALVNKGRDSEYRLPVSHLQEPLYDLGFRNSKRVIVEGDAAWYAGGYMESGIVIITGNADTLAGYEMRGGHLVIKGDAEGAGCQMRGGTVEVEGTLGRVEEGATGGRIIVSDLLEMPTGAYPEIILRER